MDSTIKPPEDEDPIPSSIPPLRRKYVTEWRTVIFIRHGKSKWNAAEGHTFTKIAAAGVGFIEYYKQKKLRNNKVQSKRNDTTDIMDAPLSREGIMEALRLCSFLRHIQMKKKLIQFENLYSKTREQMLNMIDIIDDKTIDDEHNNNTLNGNTNNINDDDVLLALRSCLLSLEEFERESLLEQHPPSDDTTLRLPPPLPEIGRHFQPQTYASQPASVSLKSKITDVASSYLLRLNETEPMNVQMDTYSSSVKISKEISATKYISSSNNSQRNSVSSDELDVGIVLDVSITNELEIEHSLVNKDIQTPTIPPTRRYMFQIEDPEKPMSSKYILSLLNGREMKTGVVVSNLRRAISTSILSLYHRLKRRPFEKVYILGCMQEIGLNSDTKPLLFTKNHKPVLSRHEKNSPLLVNHNMQNMYDNCLSTKYYKGDASDKTQQQRLQEFALWLFAQKKFLHVIAVGHSHWFQSFFRRYLPTDIEENELPANVRKAKIKNCGVVAFRIKKRYVMSKSKRHGRHISFEIAAQSISTLDDKL